MDRIDIHIEVPAVPYDELAATGTRSITSEQMRGDVTIAREAHLGEAINYRSLEANLWT